METLLSASCVVTDVSVTHVGTDSHDNNNLVMAPTTPTKATSSTTPPTPSPPPSPSCREPCPEQECEPAAHAGKKRALSLAAAGTGATGPATGSSASGAHDFDPQDLTLLKVIGRGTFAQQVALARLARRGTSSGTTDGGTDVTAELVVVKTLDKQRLIERQQVAHTLTEKRVLEALGGAHPFIVALRAAFQTDTDLNFVLEYCQGGELFFHLQQQHAQRFAEPAARFYGAEVLSALHALHAHGIVYRDLKPENVLLDAQGHVKLADFGFAKQDMAAGARTFSFCGSPEYLSPEMAAKRGHGVETDMWSFGCFLFELLTGAPPFQHSNLRRLFDLIEEGRVWYPPYLSGAAVSLLQGLLRVNPRSRLTATQAMDHAFFRALDWAELLQRQVPPPIVPACAGRECTQNFDDGFTSEPVKALRVTKATSKTATTASSSVSPKGIDVDWTKRPRQDSVDVFCGF